VVFHSISARNHALTTHSSSLPSKLWYKLFPCCSPSRIRDHHITVLPAMAPDDILWENLENPYLTTKATRVLSFIICAVMLAFGIAAEVIFFNNGGNNMDNGQGFMLQVFSSTLIWAINYIIINIL
jgi:hypothetical protein